MKKGGKGKMEKKNTKGVPHEINKYIMIIDRCSIVLTGKIKISPKA